MILQTLKIDLKIEQYIAITYKYLIKQINWQNMKTHYSILLSANISLLYLNITCVPLMVLPEGRHTPAHCTTSSTAGQPMWIIDKGASRTHPV